MRSLGIAAVCCAASFAFGQAGQVDPTFFADADATVYAIAVQPNGRVLIGGAFSRVNGIERHGLARLNLDGTLDPTFDPGSGKADGDVGDIVLQPDGKILVGGTFSSFNGGPGGLLRLNSDGTVDAGFRGSVITTSLAYHPSGKIYVGSYAGSRIIRLNADGTVDPTFTNRVTDPTAYVLALKVQSDGKVLFGGQFDEVNNHEVNHLARLNADGSIDQSFFAESPAFQVSTLSLADDGRIYQGGWAFSRLFPDGRWDESFSYSLTVNGVFFASGLQFDGKPLAGGSFSDLNGSGRDYLVRFDEDGSLDETFGAELNGPVQALVIQNDQRVLVGGTFSAVNGASGNNIVRLLGDIPVLNAQRLRGGKIMLSWPAAYRNWILQATKNERRQWKTLNIAPTVVDGVNFVTSKIGQHGKFYRLIPE